MLSGVSPFLDESEEETCSNILRNDYCFPDEYFAGISTEVKDFIRNMLVDDLGWEVIIEVHFFRTYPCPCIFEAFWNISNQEDFKNKKKLSWIFQCKNKDLMFKLRKKFYFWLWDIGKFAVIISLILKTKQQEDPSFKFKHFLYLIQGRIFGSYGLLSFNNNNLKWQKCWNSSNWKKRQIKFWN